MKKRLLFLHILLFILILSLPNDLFAQGVGIGTTTPDTSAALDITHTSKGLLIPRMNTTAILSIITPARGLMVYDSLTNQLVINTGTSTVPNWQPVASGSSASSANGWNLTGNSGIDPSNQFIGNTDNQPLRFRINNIQAGELNPVTGNISWGLRAGQDNTTGFSNIAIGSDALKSSTFRTNLIAIGDSALFNSGDAIFNIAIGSKALFSNTTGSSNTATGFESLRANTTGGINTAYGTRALYANTTGRFNAATGFSSLFSNTSGEDNTATGNQTLLNNTTGVDNTATGNSSLFNNNGNLNTATGSQSLFENTTGAENTGGGAQSLFTNSVGNDNTAHGFKSLFANTGSFNTATGAVSLLTNTTGNFNTANAYRSLFSNTTGDNNTAMGSRSLFSNTTGSNNTAIGVNALINTIISSGNTVIGSNAASTHDIGINNTLIGANADVSEDGLTNCVAIGESSICTASDQVRIGNTATSSIIGAVEFTSLSDGRFKKNIQETVKGIDFIMKLRPVTYQLDIEGLNRKLYPGKKMDGLSKGMAANEKTIFSGFVAQEVEQAAKDAGYDFNGVDKPKNENDMYGLRYAEFVVPLVKAVQEQQQQIKELNKQNDASIQLINELRKRLDELEKKVK